MSENSELTGFQEIENPEIDQETQDRKDINSDFNQAKLDDLTSRRYLRYWVAASVAIIMLIQMGGLFYYLCIAFKQHSIDKLQWLFITFFGGLFSETYLLSRLIVTWLFKDVPYTSDHEIFRKGTE